MTVIARNAVTKQSLRIDCFAEFTPIAVEGLAMTTYI